MAGLLGNGPSRQFKIFRSEFPAIFRFNGMLFEEFYDLDANEYRWEMVSEEEAQRWLEAQSPLAVEEPIVEGCKIPGCYGQKPDCAYKHIRR